MSLKRFFLGLLVAATGFAVVWTAAERESHFARRSLAQAVPGRIYPTNKKHPMTYPTETLESTTTVPAQAASPDNGGTDDSFPRLTQREKATIEQITGIFENGVPDPQYAYIEDVEDGGGITAGAVGFTTTAGDLLQVTKDYLADKSANPQLVAALSPYLDCLQSIFTLTNQVPAGTPATGFVPLITNDPTGYSCLWPKLAASNPTGMAWNDLKGWDSETFRHNTLMNSEFGLAWTNAGGDNAMWALQKSYIQKTAFRPAMEWAYRLNLRTAFSKALVYDVQVQMDVGQLAKIVRPKFKATHASDKPTNLAEELEWDALFQTARKGLLDQNPVGASTDTRVEALTQIGFPKSTYGLDPSGPGFDLSPEDANPNLKLPISFLYAGVATPFVITDQMK